MPKTLAERVVNTSLRIKPDETVTISTWQHTIDLANEIAFECRKVGAIPLITLETDDLWWKTLTKLPTESIAKEERHGLKMLEETNANIMLGGPEDPMTFRRVEGAKLAAYFKTFEKWFEKMRERKIRSAELQVGQVTKQRAKTYGFNYAQWKRTIENASNADYNKIAQLGKKIASTLEGSKKVEITTEKGTSLKLETANRPAHVEDGIVDEKDIENGFIFTSIPSGAVVTAPLETSAEGTVYFDLPRAQKGRLIKGLKWEFQGGRVVKTTAQKYPEAFLDLFDNATGDKDRIASLSIGVNPAAKPIGYFTDELGLGIVSIGIGDNRTLGGSNKSTFGFSGSLAKATVKVDGKPIVEKGKIVV